MNPFQESVCNLMSEPLVSLEEGSRVRDALEKSNLYGIHHFPIVGRDGLLALVCTCDVEGAHPDARVLDFARRRVVTCAPGDSPAFVARLMHQNAVGAVIVTEGREAWGIVTREDLVETCPELESLFDQGHRAACDARSHLLSTPHRESLREGATSFDLDGEARARFEELSCP